MFVQKIAFLLCLMASTSIGSTPPLVIHSIASATTDLALTCDVDAPENFHIEGTGPTWFNLAWDTEPLAVGGYRIRAFRTSDNALINTKYTPSAGATSITMDGLEMGEEYDLVINSICEGGENSSMEAVVGPENTLILDLIVTGVNPPNYGDYCTLTSSGYCIFDNTLNLVTGFKISKGTDSRLFGVRPILDDGDNLHFIVELEQNNSSQNLKFKIRCDAGAQTYEPDCSSSLYQISYVKNGAEAVIAKFYLENQEPHGKLHFLSLQSGYTLTRLRPDPQGRPSPSRTPVRQRDGASAEVSTPAAAPNPFSNTLDVFLGSPSTEKGNLQLLNLNGQIVLDQPLAVGQEQITLSTESIASGFYLLRIEADGVVQTLKVVKSE